MKKLILGTALIAAAATIAIFAADHIDAPAVGTLDDGSSVDDITDFYAFESPENSDNYVFVANVLGLTAPSATGNVAFDENVMYEFNIDTDGDNIENQVIQVIFRDGKVISFGPTAPTQTGLASQVETSGSRLESDITTYGGEVKTGQSNGMKLFAGPRDDPFFMDFFKFVAIVNGVGGAENPPTSFNDPGTDAFAGTNVLSVVVEVPKDMIGGSSVTEFSAWLTAKRKI